MGKGSHENRWWGGGVVETRMIYFPKTGRIDTYTCQTIVTVILGIMKDGSL